MFMCPVNGLQELGVGLRTCNMQQKGVASLLLPHPASGLHVPMLPFVEAPLSYSTVLLAVVGACCLRAWEWNQWRWALSLACA